MASDRGAVLEIEQVVVKWCNTKLITCGCFLSSKFGIVCPIWPGRPVHWSVNEFVRIQFFKTIWQSELESQQSDRPWTCFAPCRIDHLLCYDLPPCKFSDLHCTATPLMSISLLILKQGWVFVHPELPTHANAICCKKRDMFGRQQRRVLLGETIRPLSIWSMSLLAHAVRSDALVTFQFSSHECMAVLIFRCTGSSCVTSFQMQLMLLQVVRYKRRSSVILVQPLITNDNGRTNHSWSYGLPTKSRTVAIPRVPKYSAIPRPDSSRIAGTSRRLLSDFENEKLLSSLWSRICINYNINYANDAVMHFTTPQIQKSFGFGTNRNTTITRWARLDLLDLSCHLWLLPMNQAAANGEPVLARHIS